jgi:Membrane protein involved in the export of O-antigen and teichoic acid
MTIAEFINEKIFHRTKGNETILFIKNVSYVATGSLIAAGLMFAFNILAGRILGPSEYGKFTLINSIAMFLYIPMIFGMSTAMVKYSAEKRDFLRQQKIISTSYIYIIVFCLISTSIYLMFSSKIAPYFSVSVEQFHLAVIFAILFASYTLTTNTLRGLHEMKMYSIIQPIYGIIPLIVLLTLLSIDYISYESVVFSMYFAYGIVSVVIIVMIRKYLTLGLDKSWAKILIKYSTLNIFSSVSYMLYTNIDKILINKYMTVNDVGLYNAYSFSSISVMAIFSGILTTVLFPTISKYENKEETILNVNKYIPYLIFFGFILINVSQYIIISLYGNKYPIDLSLMLLFSIASVLSAIYEIYSWIFNSIGLKGVRITMKGTVTVAIINILLNLYLIPHFGLCGAISATAIAYSIAIPMTYHEWKNRFCKS